MAGQLYWNGNRAQTQKSYPGLEDEVDNRWGDRPQRRGRAGVRCGYRKQSAILQALRLGAANSLRQTGQQVVRRNLNIQPTLTIRPGFPVRVLVSRDLVLEPYRS